MVVTVKDPMRRTSSVAFIVVMNDSIILIDSYLSSSLLRCLSPISHFSTHEVFHLVCDPQLHSLLLYKVSQLKKNISTSIFNL